MLASACALSSQANPLAILRFVFGTAGVRTGVSVAARSLATATVERVIFPNGVKTVIKTVATKEIGVSLHGVAFISLAAAEIINKFDCKNVSVMGKNSGIACVPVTPPTQAMNFVINLYNTATGEREWERPAYITPKEFQFSIDFPRSVSNGVKHLTAISPQGLLDPIRSSNFYLAHPMELFSA